MIIPDSIIEYLDLNGYEAVPRSELKRLMDERDAADSRRIAMLQHYNIIVPERDNAIAEVDRLRAMLGSLGFCPQDGESLPCMTCGAGL